MRTNEERAALVRQRTETIKEERRRNWSHGMVIRLHYTYTDFLATFMRQKT